jgi:hypothetical protein
VIPRAILLAIGVGVVYYVFLSWVMAVGFGVHHIDQWATNPAALDTLSSRYAGTWLAVVVDLAVSVGAFVAALAGLNLLPLGAIAICGYTIYESYKSPGPAPNTWSPWIALVWLGIGIAVLAWLKATHPERVRSFGSILGAGEAYGAGAGDVPVGAGAPGAPQIP